MIDFKCVLPIFEGAILIILYNKIIMNPAYV